MEYELLEKLGSITEYTEELIQILKEISKDIHKEFWDNFTNRLSLYLVSLTCQTKYSQFIKQNAVVPMIKINKNVSKRLHEYILDLITDLLLKIMSCRPQSCEKICELFLDHFDAHNSCLGGLSIFYKLIFFSEELIPFMRNQTEFYCQIIELYEKNITRILKDAEPDDRIFSLNKLYSQQQNSVQAEPVDFHSQLSKYIANNYPYLYNQAGSFTPNSAHPSNFNNNSERGNHSQHYSTCIYQQVMQQQQFQLKNNQLSSVSPTRNDKLVEFEQTNPFLQGTRISQGDLSNLNYTKTNMNTTQASDPFIQNTLNLGQTQQNLTTLQQSYNSQFTQNLAQLQDQNNVNSGGSPNIFNTRNPSKRHSKNNNSNELTLTEQNENSSEINKNLNNQLQANSSIPINSNNPNLSNQNSSEQSSFMFNSKNSKAPKIPPLNLPQTNSENIGTLTRSTRRADPFKSFSTNSNRFSNSIDSGFKDQQNNFAQRQAVSFPKSINENNYSMIDGDNSYFFDDKDEKAIKSMSAMQKMSEIAQNLGEYNLTIDLGCLLAQRRKFQLDQVAKIAVFQDVDSLIDLKIDESFIKQKIKKRKRDKGSSKKAEFKQQQQQQIEQEQITLLDSIDLKELNVVAGQDNLSSNTHRESAPSISQLPNQMMLMMMNANRKKKSKTELNNIRKMLKIISNIIFMVLKDLSDQEKQFLPSPVNCLYSYLSSEVNSFNRKKDLIKFMCSRKGWDEYTEIEYESQKLNLICDGFETFAHGDSKHYERIMQDLYKKKFQPQTKHNINQQVQIDFQNKMYSNFSNQPHNVFEDQNLNQNNQNANDAIHENWNENFSLSDIEVTLEQITLPENLVYFKILDFYSIHSEKIHQIFSLKKGIFTQNMQSTDCASLKENKQNIQNQLTDARQFQMNLNAQKEQNQMLSEIKILSVSPSSEINQNSYVITNGVQIPISLNSANEIRSKTNEFLHKFEKKFRWYINNMDMNSTLYFEIEKEQLEILDGFLANCSSRIICFEVLESLIDCLLMIKRQFIELSITPTQASSRTGTNSVRITALIQNNTSLVRPTFSLSNSASKAKQNQKLLNNTLNSNNRINGNRIILDSPTKDDFISSQLNNQQAQQNSMQNSQHKFQASNNTNGTFIPINSNLGYNQQIPFVMKHKEIFGNYISIISRIMIKAPRNEMYKLLNQIYFKNENWKELIKMYSVGIFNEIIAFCSEIAPNNKNDGNKQSEKENSSNTTNPQPQKSKNESATNNQKTSQNQNHYHLQQEHINLFICAQKLLLYFKSSLIMCQNMIFRERLNEKKTEKSKEYKQFIRQLLQEMLFLIRPTNGIFYKYLTSNSEINSVIIQNNAKTKLPMSTVLRINLYKQILEFLGLAFGFCSNYSCLLNEDISSFYLKFSFTNFVKLYSHSNLNELNEISNKIRQIQQKSSSKQEIQDNINQILNKTSKESPYYHNNEMKGTGGNQNSNIMPEEHQHSQLQNLQKYYHYFKIDLLKLYIKVLFTLSTTRTEEITRKFFQYRIVEFFTREIDLEFEITQIRDRFMKVRNEAKKQMQQQQQQQQQQNSQNYSQRSPARSNQSFNNQYNNNNNNQGSNSSHNPNQKTIQINSKIQIKALNLESNNSNDQSQKQTSSEIQSITKSLNQLDYAQNSSEKQKLFNQKRQNVNKFSIGQNIDLGSRKTPGSSDLPSDGQKRISMNNQFQNQQNAANQVISNIPSQQDFQLQQEDNNSQNQYAFVNKFNQNENKMNEQNFDQNLDNLSSSSSDGILFIPTTKPQMKINIPLIQIPGQQNNNNNISQNIVDNQNIANRQITSQEQSPQPQFANNNGITQNKPNLKFSLAGIPLKGEQGKPNSESNYNNIPDNQNKNDSYNIYNQTENLQERKKGNKSKRSDDANEDANQSYDQYMNSSSSSEGNYQIPLITNTAPKIPLPAINLNKLISGSNLPNSGDNTNKAFNQTFKNMKKESNDYSIPPLSSTQKSNKPSLSLNLGKLSKGGQESSQKSGGDRFNNPMTQDCHNSNINSKNSNTNNNSNNTGYENLEVVLNENIFYYQERKLRKIYADDELHAYVLSTILSLLLTPTRGTLDELYCSSQPMLDDKQNVLFLLHFHLNHPSNQSILPYLLQQICHIKPFPAGQRLLKLLCAALNDFSIYTDLQFMASGQFGSIFEAKTNLSDPQIVAIKQMDLPKSIYDRCVLHDIFNEITCLELFRFDQCVTDLYDYGLADNDYKIIMKRYPMSLKQWRQQQKSDQFTENLPTYLNIYRDALKAVQLLHSNSVIHYDIKADNILLDFPNKAENGNSNDQSIKVVLGDFGVCKMFRNEEDEYCLVSKGTQFIQSPEMQTLAIQSKKEGDKYDRRKKVGTTRSSDVWSLGCLLYEILTNEFLFYNQNETVFLFRVTTNTEQILTQENLEKVQYNMYAIDFLKYILVRDQQIRPNIDNVIKRFEHVYTQIVSNSNPISTYVPTITNPQTPSIPANWSFETIINNYIQNILFPQDSVINSPTFNPKINQKLNIKHIPSLIKIMEEIYICSYDYFIEHQDRLMLSGITHVISEYSLLSELDLTRFTYLLLDQSQIENKMSSIFRLSPKVMDYLREIFLFRGKILFVEDNEINIYSPIDKLLLRNILIFCLTYFFKCSAYETLTLINSQVLFLQVPYYCLNQIIYSSSHLFKIENYLDSYPKAQCICGCTTFVLKKNFTSSKKMPQKLCNCTKESKQNEASLCPSDGCSEYLRFIRKRYKLNWDALKWVMLQPSNFLIGPFDCGQIQEDSQIQVILNSEGPTKNITPYYNSEQEFKSEYSTAKESEWTTYKCKICHMWMYSMNNKNQQIVFIMNNMIRRNRQGITIANNFSNQKIKTPILRHFNLYELK
ncbi:hypothetical protein ABPG74_001826 [Tetrahymena malaccensis]